MDFTKLRKAEDIPPNQLVVTILRLDQCLPGECRSLHQRPTVIYGFLLDNNAIESLPGIHDIAHKDDFVWGRWRAIDNEVMGAPSFHMRIMKSHFCYPCFSAKEAKRIAEEGAENLRENNFKLTGIN